MAPAPGGSVRQMARKTVAVADLVGTREIAERLGRRAGLVKDWRLRDGSFPEPLTTVSSVYVWAWPDVEAWARRTGRL